MKNYLLHRILTSLLVLIGISILSFILGVLSPGDPAELVLNQNGLENPTEQQILAMREELGLNQPLYLQYANWINNLFSGNLGVSYITGRDILQEILLRLPTTIELALMALFIATFLGISLGIYCAVNEGKFIDNLFKVITNAMFSIPSFWLALILILVFCEQLKLLPTSSDGSIKSLLMPVFILAFSTIGTLIRLTRNSLLVEFSKQYYIVAKLRGIPTLKLLVQYALPNAILPVIALLGNYFAGILGGSVIVESIFAIPGISFMALQAVSYRDYPVLQAYVLVSGIILVLITMLVDILIMYINPKIKMELKQK